MTEAPDGHKPVTYVSPVNAHVGHQGEGHAGGKKSAVSGGTGRWCPSQPGIALFPTWTWCCDSQAGHSHWGDRIFLSNHCKKIQFWKLIKRDSPRKAQGAVTAEAQGLWS